MYVHTYIYIFRIWTDVFEKEKKLLFINVECSRVQPFTWTNKIFEQDESKSLHLEAMKRKNRLENSKCTKKEQRKNLSVHMGVFKWKCACTTFARECVCMYLWWHRVPLLRKNSCSISQRSLQSHLRAKRYVQICILIYVLLLQVCRYIYTQMSFSVRFSCARFRNCPQSERLRSSTSWLGRLPRTSSSSALPKFIIIFKSLNYTVHLYTHIQAHTVTWQWQQAFPGIKCNF